MKRLLTAKSAFTIVGWTMFLSMVIWLINYHFVTPGIAFSARETSIWTIVSFLVVVTFKKLYGRMRRPPVPKK